MSGRDDSATSSWRFFRFGLIVTGKGEREFLPGLFRSLTASSRCSFSVIGKIGQRSPRTSPKIKAKMVSTGKLIPDRDADTIGIPARRHLNEGGDRFVILVDDLEFARRDNAWDVFSRYRTAMDVMLKGLQNRASVHFLVNMLEAYYFADAKAVKEVLGLDLGDGPDDVECIRHPKHSLEGMCRRFDPVEHGNKIIARLDLRHVLENPGTCGWLRTLVGWCIRAMGGEMTDQYQLRRGIMSVVTGPQLASLPVQPGSPIGSEKPE